MTEYTTEVHERVVGDKGYCHGIRVDILADGVKIGEYDRNYGALYNTFYPFTQNGKDYALYSKDYTSTRVMSLPDCKDIAGEEPNTWGFCPTGYYVPHTKYVGKDFGEGKIVGPDGQFGFVCGCVWGDDYSWKIQYLDLTKINEGVLTRDDRFGYIELLGSANELDKAIEVENFTAEDLSYDHVWITIACKKTFDHSGRGV